MPNLPEFLPGQTARSAHQSLKQSLEILDRAQHCAVLWFGEIMRREILASDRPLVLPPHTLLPDPPSHAECAQRLVLANNVR